MRRNEDHGSKCGPAVITRRMFSLALTVPLNEKKVNGRRPVIFVASLRSNTFENTSQTQDSKRFTLGVLYFSKTNTDRRM